MHLFHDRRNAVWISALFSLWTASAIPQSLTDRELYPAREFLLSAGVNFYAPLRAADQTGPNQTFTGVVLPGLGFQAGHRWWFSGDRRWGLGFGIALEQVPYSYKYYVQNSEVYDVPYPDGTERMPIDRMLQIQTGISLHRRQPMQNDWSIDISTAGLLTVIDGNTFFYRIGDGSLLRLDDSSYVWTDRLFHELNTEVMFAIQLGGSLNKRFENFNTLSLQLVAQITPGPAFLTGNYVLYPNTPYESTGTYSQRANFLGIRLAYALAYGPPKLPRHVRRNLQ